MALLCAALAWSIFAAAQEGSEPALASLQARPRRLQTFQETARLLRQPMYERPPRPELPADPPGCQTDLEWSNYHGHTCASYYELKWCAGGTVLVPGYAGTLMGSPEWACCVCNYRRHRPDSERVNEVIFYATHKLENEDMQILSRYREELQPVYWGARVWTLFFNQGNNDIDPMNRPEFLVNVPTPVCIWSLENLYKLFPTLKSAILNTASYRQTGGYLAYYFWFHMSLFLWLK